MRYIVFVIAMICSLTSWAKEPDAALKHIREIFASVDSYRVDFNSTLEGEFYDMQGSVTIDNKGRYFMDIITAKVIYDGDSQYMYIPERREVTIERTKRDSKNFLTDPSGLFSLNEKDFTTSMATARRNAKSYTTLTLIPKQKQSEAKQIVLYVDSSDMPKIIEVTMSNGNLFTLNIDKITLPYPASNDTFIFTKDRYPGAEIIDLR